jgi:hypothetical protein
MCNATLCFELAHCIFDRGCFRSALAEVSNFNDTSFIALDSAFGIQEPKGAKEKERAQEKFPRFHDLTRIEPPSRAKSRDPVRYPKACVPVVVLCPGCRGRESREDLWWHACRVRSRRSESFRKQAAASTDTDAEFLDPFDYAQGRASLGMRGLSK